MVASAPHSADMKKTRLRAGSPAELLALGPYLLGFEPTESIVVVAVSEGESAGVARADLEAFESDRQLARRTWQTLSRPTPDAHALILGYGADHERMVAALRSVACSIEEWTGSLLVDHVCFTDGHLWWPLWEDWEFDPDAGQPYDPAPPSVVQAVCEGLSVTGDRAQLERSVEGPRGKQAASFAAKVRRQLRLVGSMTDADATTCVLDLLMRGLEAPAGMDDLDQARLVALVQKIHPRDDVWLSQTRASAEQHQVLWHHLAQRTPVEFAVPVLSLLGFAAWLSGHGALANIACLRALSLDPCYRMARLLDEALVNGAHPDLWNDMPDVSA